MNPENIYPRTNDHETVYLMRTPLCKISSTGEIEQRFRLN